MINRRGLTFDDVLLVPSYCGMRSRRTPSTHALLGTYQFYIPIISANMDTITEEEMACAMSVQGGLGIIHRFMSVERNAAMFKSALARTQGHIGVSVGVGNDEFARADALMKVGARILCVDVAHGHAKMVGKQVKRIRAMMDLSYKGEECILIAGNVATYAGADYLASCGADVIKVGIGPGSVCTTRIKTGFGVPQLTAIMDCARGSKPIIADGGMRTPGDVVKALAAGASMVMLGGMLAGTDEAAATFVGDGNGLGAGTKVFRGMASKEAQDDSKGGMHDWATAEGVAVTVPVIGPVAAVIRDVMGGLRSGMTYAGASDLAELRRRVEFIEVTPAAVVEGTPHLLQRRGY